MLAHLTVLFAAAVASVVAAPLTVPFDFSRHEIGLNVSVQGKPLYMLLDTGVSPSVIDVKRAQALRLPLNLRGAGEGSGEGGGQQLAIPSTIQRLAIGGRDFGDIEALATGLRDMSTTYGRPLDGVLGYSFIRRNLTLIDYPAHTVTFFVSASEAAVSLRQCRTRYAVPFVSFRDEEFPIVQKFRIGRITVPAALDTGSNRALGLYRRALWLDGIRGTFKEQETQEARSFGGGYTTTDIILNVPVGIGPFEAAAGLKASVMPDLGSANTRLAKIGNRLLASMKLRLLLDYAGKRISFYGGCGR